LELKESNAKIGLVTISPERRETLAAWCSDNSIANIAFTDIKHLIDKDPEIRKITPFTTEDYGNGLPLWVC